MLCTLNLNLIKLCIVENSKLFIKSCRHHFFRILAFSVFKSKVYGFDTSNWHFHLFWSIHATNNQFLFVLYHLFQGFDLSINTIYLSILECFEHVEVTDWFLLIIMDDLSMIPSIFLETIYQSTIIVDNIFLCLLCLVDYVHVRLKCGTAKDKISDDQQQKERQTNTAIKPPRISLYSSSTFLKFIFNEANLLQFSILRYYLTVDFQTYLKWRF